MTIPADERKEIRELCERASAAPWIHRHNDGTCVYNSKGVYLAETDVAAIPAREMTANAHFIAASRALIPRLLDELEAVEREPTSYRETEGTNAICFEKVVADRDKARAEVERWRNCAICIECGRCKFDEDGCCATCGRDCIGFENGKLVDAGVADHIDAIEGDRNRLLDEVEALKSRQQELLATIVRLTNETPFADEAKDALEQRGKLVAEIGTLKAERDDLHRELKAAVDYAIDVVGMPARAMLGPDAPVRVMRHLHERNERLVSDGPTWLGHAICVLHECVDLTDPSDPVGTALTRAGLERKPYRAQLAYEEMEADRDQARRECEAVRAENERMRAVFHAAVDWHAAYDSDAPEMIAARSVLYDTIEALASKEPPK